MAEKKKTEPTTEVAVWKPKEFAGNDLLPLDEGSAIAVIEGIPELVGRDHVDPDDLVLPALNLLHGTSEAVTSGVEGAAPGLFMHTGTEEVLEEGPLRLIFAHHHKGNALFPKEGDRYKDLETCISPDGVEGNVYGSCEDCRKCLDWDNVNNFPPLGAQVHHFVGFTSMGPIMLRFSRSSYKAANKFISSWVGSRKNLWTHPVVIRVVQGDKTLPTGKVTKYFTLQLAWQVTEKVPAELQLAAYELYKSVAQKHETGNLKSQDDGADTGDPEFDL
jgi:hypothetical protein